MRPRVKVKNEWYIDMRGSPYYEIEGDAKRHDYW